MTNKEINDAILKTKGCVQYIGNKDNLSPIVYFFLMDASFQIFQSNIRNKECTGQQKRLMNQMIDGYNLFFKDFFHAFNQDQIDYLIDKLDSFEDYINPHLEIAEIAMQECDNEKSIQVQKDMSSVWLCNILAADAQDMFGECWKTSHVRPDKNKYIGQVVAASKQYSLIRFGQGQSINQKKFDRLQKSVKVIAHKVMDWILDDYNKELEKTSENI